MGYHTFDVERADDLEDAGERYRYCSAEELLGALALSGDERVADLGSGTGFYTDDVAGYASKVYAVDVQPGMHDYYREKGVPDGVDLVTASIDDLPFGDELDAAFSTMTYHEFHSDDALAAIAHALHGDGRLVLVDWSATGSGEAGPPVEERFDLATVSGHLEGHGFDVDRADDRPETWFVVARPRG